MAPSLVEPGEEVGHGEQVAEPAGRVHLVHAVELLLEELLPASGAAVAEPMQRHGRHVVDLLQLHGPLALLIAAWARTRTNHARRIQTSRCCRRDLPAHHVVRAQPVREHDLGSHGPARGSSQAARVLGRRRLARLRRLRFDALVVVRVGGGVGRRRRCGRGRARLLALHPLPEVRVPVVLHLVVGPPRQMPCDPRPPVRRRVVEKTNQRVNN
jgi:hypothetical protein